MAQRPRLNRYSWEGVYSADFTLDSFQRHCRRLADVLVARKWSGLVAHDTRFMAGQFARYAYRSLEARGVRVSCCPTPAAFPAVELALDQKRADAALIVSAGNRPFWYNGMIVLAPLDLSPFAGEPATGDQDPAVPFPPDALENTENTSIDRRTPYLDMLRDSVDMDLIHRATLTVFVDPMNGATSGYIPGALGDGGQTKAIEINRETDPLFGRQPPQPAEAGLNRLRKLVKESDSHLGVALSADGRAIGVADNLGEIVPSVDVALLLAHYLSRQYRQRGAIVVPALEGGAEVAAAIRAWEDSSGLKVELASDPAARIADLLSQDRNSLLVGTTGSGEITLGRYGLSPDATLAALVLIESVARSGGRMRALLDDMKGKIVKREA
jgi:phosphomannomutase